MFRRLQALFVLLALCVVPMRAAADNSVSTADANTPPPDADDAGTKKAQPTEAPAAAPPPAPGERPATNAPASPPAPPEWYRDWHTEITGYFRAPLAMGISKRTGPDDPTGPAKTQVSYGPNRTVDASYYAFTYTRLQEQDWAELFVHEKHKHVDAVLGMMGYWFQSAGFRNPDASWFPGMAYVTLDSDVALSGLTSNIALTMGAWWPRFGYMEKYDTYTLGRFRQLGEQLRWTVPINADLTVVATQGFGTVRDGSFNYQAPPLYGAIVGLDLLTYEDVHVTYGRYFDVGLHYNNEWTSDPNLTQSNMMSGKSYAAASDAHLSVVGAEANLSAPYAGRLWISPSLISVKNGWALANGGTEVMHSLGGAGIATNYMGFNDNPASSTGSGSMFNLGFVYENTLSGVQGKPKGSMKPEVTLDVFGLLADASLDLPAGSTFGCTGSPCTPQNALKAFKYGADVTVQPLDWLGVLARFDEVNIDLDHPGYIFNVVTGRVIVSSHFLSSESIYLQYSRYTYGANMQIAGTWLGGLPEVSGNTVLQEGPYAGMKPDMDVVKLQATVAF